MLSAQDSSLYDYSSDDNILDRSTLVESLVGMRDFFFHILPTIPLRLFVIVLVWYPIHREHFGHCPVCFFTLFGFVEQTDSWRTLQSMLGLYDNILDSLM